MILINTTYQNIWVRQPLLANELFEVEVEPQQCCTQINQDLDEMFISLLLSPTHEEHEQVEYDAVEVEENQDPPKKDTLTVEHPKLESGLTLGRPMILKKR